MTLTDLQALIIRLEKARLQSFERPPHCVQTRWHGLDPGDVALAISELHLLVELRKRTGT